MKIQGYVLHVKTAYEREKSMLAQIKQLGFNFKFILDGDIKDLTPQILSHNFKGNLAVAKAVSSCAYKHILALNDMISNNINYGIVFEDDILLDKNANESLSKIFDEIKGRNINNFYLSLEETNFQFVKRSARKQGRNLYKIERGEYSGKLGYDTRCAGAYIIDFQAAKNVLDEAASNKIDVPIDWFYTSLVAQKIINLYYLHPTIACQGSHNNNTGSLIETANRHSSLSYLLKKHYKKILYWLR